MLAVPVPLEKVLVPSRDGGSGSDVRARPWPGSGGEGALGASCSGKEGRQHWQLTSHASLLGACDGHHGASTCCRGAPPKPLMPFLCSRIQITADPLKLTFFTLTFKAFRPHRTSLCPTVAHHKTSVSSRLRVQCQLRTLAGAGQPPGNPGLSQGYLSVGAVRRVFLPRCAATRLRAKPAEPAEPRVLQGRGEVLRLPCAPPANPPLCRRRGGRAMTGPRLPGLPHRPGPHLSTPFHISWLFSLCRILGRCFVCLIRGFPLILLD